MSNYIIIETETYQKETEKWTKSDREAAKNITQKLA